ncbi:glycosyltransferase [Microvirga antarctica]|uniref:glycosyltransferase n=1 Tax=Microvirga antarctica TaxID=2819233 RepID=UPI001B303F40|nr:glycosyltransferase [Microvirga antarctica]
MPLTVLFLHQNFPGQYKLLADHLSRSEDVTVVAVGQKSPSQQDFGRVRYESYSARADFGPEHFPPLHFFSEQVRRGDMVRWKLLALKHKGFSPDICFVHPAWGEALFLRDVFPNTKIVSHLEFYYRGTGSDLDFDPEFPVPATDLHYVSLRNLPTLQTAAISDILVSPTVWQANTFPTALSQRAKVIHEGIDTALASPAPASPLHLGSGLTLAPGGTLITYVARSMEPYRGFHTFMRALPHLLRLLPHAQVAIVGKDEPSYGRRPAQGGSWKQAMLAEVGAQIDRDRVHFLGTLTYSDLIALFRLSTVHAYLTYPFVLSWSLLDGMACGCAVVGSATAPVMEVIRDGQNGVLADFFDARALAETIAATAENARLRAHITINARQTIMDSYDFRGVSLPAYESLIRTALDA